MIPVLPDAFRIGPAAIPTPPLFIVLGVWAAYMTIGRRARRFGLAADGVESTMLWTLVIAWVGAKLPELVRSPASIIGSPRLWLAIPIGGWPIMGAVVGAVVGLLVAHKGRQHQMPSFLDTAAVPVLLGLAVACLGIRDARAIPLAAALLLAALLVRILEGQARFGGHVFWAGIVLGALAVAIGDLFIPLAGGWTLISPAQLASVIIGLVGFTVAWWQDGGAA